jgi:two-component system, NtrC family, sensor kinase
MNRRIIVIDDEESIQFAYREILGVRDPSLRVLEAEAAQLEAALFGPGSDLPASEWYELTSALQGEEGYRKVKAAVEQGNPYALAFVDIRMPPGWDGMQTAKMIREVDQQIEIVLITAYSDRDRQELVREIGLPDKLLYLKKPFDPEEIRQVALSLTRKWELERQSERQRNYLERLMLAVRRLKTLEAASLLDVLKTVLNEVLLFANVQQGFIAKVDGERVEIEIVSEAMDLAQTWQVVDKLHVEWQKIDSIRRLDGVLVFPLRDVSGSLFILAVDADAELDDEQLKLLALLLETCSEVLVAVRKRDKALRNERIAALGQMAAGIIHEVNNPLSQIVMASQLCHLLSAQLWSAFQKSTDLYARASVSPAIRWELEQIQRETKPAQTWAEIERHQDSITAGIKQVGALMKNVREFARIEESLSVSEADVCDVLESTLTLAGPTLKAGVVVHRDWEAPIPIPCNVAGLKQVFLNLVLNAVQAMDGRGELWIEAHTLADEVAVVIRDSGPGIEDVERIFLPFYTTKREGTGLGLSIVRGIVHQHGGRLEVTSTRDVGSTFRIRLPRVKKPDVA